MPETETPQKPLPGGLIEIAGDTRPAAGLTLPDRAFRAAWRFKGDAVVIDMAVAREVHRDALRRRRAPLLAKLDTAWMRAMEAGDTAAAASIAARKQALRDVTKHARLDAAKTPAALSALTLEALLG